MTLDEAFSEIRQFWPGGLPFAFRHGRAAGRLVAEFGRPLPAELAAYLDTFAPAEDVDFETVGNPLRLYGLSSLGVHQPGYNWNPVTNEPIADWPASFFEPPPAGAWRRLVDALDARLTSVEDMRAATDAASRVFSLFERSGRLFLGPDAAP